MEKNEPDALARLTGLYQAIARTSAWAGLCYTQLTDVEQEINGLMTYDRKPKFDVTKVKQINDPCTNTGGAFVPRHPCDRH